MLNCTQKAAWFCLVKAADVYLDRGLAESGNRVRGRSAVFTRRGRPGVLRVWGQAL